MTCLPVLSVIGLGKLGAPMAACMAARGCRVIGVDHSPHVVAGINSRSAPVQEPRLQEMIDAAGDRLSATTDTQAAVRNSAVTFILVPTPSDSTGRFGLEHVLEACREVGAALGAKSGRHTVVITSTVMPGATDTEIRPVLEQASRKRAGSDFGLCYSPEFIALGTVVPDFLNPDFVLIGESDPDSGALLEHIYGVVCENNPPAARMSCLNAELTKLAVNTFVTTKISFANTLARICERLPGADVDAVTAALGRDSRIGEKCLKGAVGYGGPCFPRDVVALTRLVESVGGPADLPATIDRLNRAEARGLADLVCSRLPAGGQVAVLGLAYKPQTPVVDESQGLMVARILADRGVIVEVYDPLALENARRELGAAVSYASDPQTCVANADVVVITTPWGEFRQLTAQDFCPNGKRPVLIDCWRMFRDTPVADRTEYVALGVGACGPVTGEGQR